MVWVVPKKRPTKTTRRRAMERKSRMESGFDPTTATDGAAASTAVSGTASATTSLGFARNFFVKTW
jgi:hypothetical protein